MTNAKGRFGIHGGQYIPETLMNAVIELEEAYERYKDDPQFNKELSDLFGSYASLTAFTGDPLVLLTVAVLIILGGLGFSVILETIRNRNGFRNLSLHSRIVLMTTLVLLFAGTVFYWLAERANAETLAGRGEGEIILNAFFQSVTMRTAG